MRPSVSTPTPINYKTIANTLAVVPQSTIDWGNTEIDRFKLWFESAQNNMSFAEFECRVKDANLDLNRFVGAATYNGFPPGQPMMGTIIKSIILSYTNARRREMGAERNNGSACGGTNPAGYWKCKTANWEKAMFEACGKYPAGYTPPPENEPPKSNNPIKNLFDRNTTTTTTSPFYTNPILWIILIIILIIVGVLVVKNK